MISVIIPTLDSERILVPTLGALVSGATSGLISEVVIADGGSRDETAAVADVAGCNFVAIDGPLGRRLKAAASAARAPWLLFLRPGTILDAPWPSEAGRFIERSLPKDRAAAFRRTADSQSPLRETLSLLAGALGRRPQPQQGLLIAKHFYETLGGHSERAADPEAEFMKRIGNSRIVRLSTPAFSAL